MAVGNINTTPKEQQAKKPEGFDQEIMSKTMAKMYKNKKQFDNSINVRRGKLGTSEAK